MKAVIVHLKDDGDLYRKEFETEAEARAWIENNEWKAILIVGENLKTEDYT